MTRTLIFTLTTLLATACATSQTYLARPTTGTVVDAGTKEPVAGAVVIAEWIVEGGMEHSKVGTFKVIEVATDKAGRFVIPGWGPEARPPNGILDKFDPLITVLKAGYVVTGLVNKPPSKIGERAALQDHSWLSKTEVFEIPKAVGPPRYYVSSWEGLYSRLYGVLDGGALCDWKRLPRTIRILEDQEKLARSQGLRPLYHLSAKELMERKQCAPFGDFMRAYSEIN